MLDDRPINLQTFPFPLYRCGECGNIEFSEDALRQPGQNRLRCALCAKRAHERQKYFWSGVIVSAFAIASHAALGYVGWLLLR